MTETAITFACENEELLGILHSGHDHATSGVLIVVGGPQYRVGSHRQFVLLARYLAAQGFPVFRFDYRAMGDASGHGVDFMNVDIDIRAAMDVFFDRVSGLEKVVIWGLCDAASAALFYAFQDSRVSSLILLNPWVRTEEGLAKTHLKQYYAKRFLSLELWKSVFSGKLNVARSLGELVHTIRKVLFGKATTHVKDDETDMRTLSLPDRMREGLKRFQRPVLFILSGNNDFVADEFRQLIHESESWDELIGRGNIKQFELLEANHTFSRSDWRKSVEELTTEWIQSTT